MDVVKLLRATHEGVLPIGDKELKCAVLDDGTRILSISAIFKAFDRPARGNARLGSDVPVFIDAKNLQDFIDDDIAELIKPIHYVEKNGVDAKGYNALIITALCKLYLDAKAANALKTSQLPLARTSEKLLIALANKSIIDLVDQATGYSFDREKKEVEIVLKALVSDEILEWQQAFHLSFYKEIYRIWGIPFTPDNIRHKPQFIGHITNKYIYGNMPKGTIVLNKLKEKTPKTKAGNFKVRLHQSLTKEAGRETLKKVIYTVEALASISKDKEHFFKLIAEKYGQKELPFPALDKLDPPNKSSIQQKNNTAFDQALKGILSVPKPPKEEK